MKYKVEKVTDGGIVEEYYYANMSHPSQAARHAVSDGIGGEHYIMLIANEYGEVWQMVVKKQDKSMKIRTMVKYGPIMTADDVDMLFTRNMKIYGGILK